MDVNVGTSQGSVYSSANMARTMVLEEPIIRDNDVDNPNNILLDFERPFHERCDPVLTPLPVIHPTCNSIHELSLTTSETDSALLSMKGSWRSVWKIDLDRRQREQISNNNTVHMNETSSSLSSNATTEFIQELSASSSSSSSIVLKMLHLHRQFDRQSYDAHATDIVVMDRLTASPYRT